MLPIVDNPVFNLPKYPTEFGQARQIAIRTAPINNGMGIGQKFGEAYGDAGNLIDPVTAVFHFGVH